MVIAASPTIERMVVATSPTPLPTNTPAGSAPIVAPTPTPVVVQPKPTASGKEPLRPDEASTIPARRLVIPRIELDMVVKEVTIDLDTWQVADFAVGHHLGTANPGQVGNMVLVGHRDVRGSVFLRLNELQAGDDFKVFTDKAVYRYIVTGISEVAPTEVDVMSPTSDPTATLITCTPIGYATRRLIVKARLQS
jgi:sortase A